jgi:hypothetical protein
MKTKRFTAEQIIAVLKEANGDMPVKELALGLDTVYLITLLEQQFRQI